MNYWIFEGIIFDELHKNCGICGFRIKNDCTSVDVASNYMDECHFKLMDYYHNQKRVVVQGRFSNRGLIVISVRGIEE